MHRYIDFALVSTDMDLVHSLIAVINNNLLCALAASASLRMRRPHMLPFAVGPVCFLSFHSFSHFFFFHTCLSTF